jgi:hypothetical protein
MAGVKGRAGIEGGAEVRVAKGGTGAGMDGLPARFAKGATNSSGLSSFSFCVPSFSGLLRPNIGQFSPCQYQPSRTFVHGKRPA